jgi:hypothetical protein
MLNVVKIQLFPAIRRIRKLTVASVLIFANRKPVCLLAVVPVSESGYLIVWFPSMAALALE